LLTIQQQVAAPRPIPIGQFAVLIEQDRQPVGDLAQLFGFEPARQCGQLRLGGLAGVEIDEAGQPVEEPPNDPHVLDPDIPAALRSGGV